MNVCFLKTCLWKWPETHCSRVGSFWAEQLLMDTGITSRLTDRWIGWLLKLSWWADVSPLFSFFLITVNSLFLEFYFCAGSQWGISVYPEYCFSANKPGVLTLPKLTKNELEWTVWALIVSRISVRSPALEKETCMMSELSQCDCRQRHCS